MSAEFDKSNKTLSILSFVTALIGVVLYFIPTGADTLGVTLGTIALVALVLSIIFGAIALKKKQGIKGLAVAGLVISIVFLALTIIAVVGIIGIIVGLATAGGMI